MRIPIVVAVLFSIGGLLGCEPSPYDNPTSAERAFAPKVRAELFKMYRLPENASWDALYQARTDDIRVRLCAAIREKDLVSVGAQCTWDHIQSISTLAEHPEILGDIQRGNSATAALLAAIETVKDKRDAARGCGLREDASWEAIYICKQKKDLQNEIVLLRLPPGSEPDMVLARMLLRERKTLSQ